MEIGLPYGKRFLRPSAGTAWEVKISGETLQALKNIVGAENVITEKEKLEDYSHDELALTSYKSYPEAVVKPGNTQQVADVLRLANTHLFPVTVRGGATGLCGGCIPNFGGVALSLENMNRILEIDQANLLCTLESGVTLREFYQALRKEKLFFPPHPGEESATIGGAIATNAGGSRAVKYGVVRNFVRGLEVVLPTGDIINLGGKVIKDSSGYSLLHLLTGSEGTLGIITRATLSVMAQPAFSYTLLVPYGSVSEALRSVPEMLRSGILPLAVEFVTRPVIAVAEGFLGKKWPVQSGEIHLMIILEGGREEELSRLSESISEICLQHDALDVFVAKNQEKQEEILNLRSMVYEALKPKTLEILDVVLPRDQMEPHLKVVEDISGRYDIWLPTYGHAGDGNLHTHIMKTDRAGQLIDHWEEKYRAVRLEIHQDARKRGGRVSGEHGIGLAKKEYLAMFHDEASLKLMKQIKVLFDPNCILNPGKVFDAGRGNS